MARPRRRGAWAGPWEGGRIWKAADGSVTYYIRRQVGGRVYSSSTGATTRRSAMAQLERFEKDPEGYRPEGDIGPAPIFLTNELAEDFLGWSKNERGNSAGWVAKQKSIMTWWGERLDRVDLRRASLRDDILPPLKGATSQAQRKEVLKTFYGWLRKVKRDISTQEDPTFGALPAEQAKPAQRKKSKVIPVEHYRLAHEHLVGVFRDALDVLAGSGWHVTEMVRFAQAGAIEPLPKSMRVLNGAVGVLVCPMHKSGDTHRTAVSQEVLDAAIRLRAHGWPFDSAFPFYQAVKAACLAVNTPDGKGIACFSPGRFRHSVATWAFEKGADPAAVSAFLGHKSPQTTKRFYATLATVPKIPTLA